MQTPSIVPYDPRPAPLPRFSLGRGVTKWAACLWLWTSASGLAATVPEVAPAPYRQAVDLYNRQNYDRALGLLERTPDDGNPGSRADVLNLRGAIYLRQGRFAEARATFAEAAKVDPRLWAAKFNEAEVTFRQGRYAASRQEFDALRDHTSRWFHPEERRFLEYKLLLTDVCSGQEQSTLEFIAEHRTDPAPPLAWYYLNAALEQRHDRPQKAAQWLAQAEAKAASGNREPYVESFELLGWTGDHARTPGHETLASNRLAARRPGDGSTSRIARTSGRRARASRPAEADEPAAPASAPATLAMVQLMPDRSAAAETDGKDGVRDERTSATAVPQFRAEGMPPAPVDGPSASGLPPTGTESDPGSERVPAERVASPVASVLAKPRRAKGTPTPSPTPTDTPAADAGTGSGSGAAASTPTAAPSATPAATPAASPTAEFTEKYEAAYVKFIDKDYPGTLALLQEAEQIQPKQPQAATLRAQVFKQEYEAAYLAFRKADFTGALDLLDLADSAQPNYPDALNLRGLVYSKQHAYDRAEAMFKKAVETDPTLWAAKFNYAELPFNRGDYTTARGRFEDLLAETDAAKRPREAELTEYKVFLTLLLEGKTDQARSFMDHFNFSGATPAKYFCNAAMNFRAGTVDKANGWVDSAKREYPAQLVAIFVESFYRLGWMSDPNAPVPGTAIAAASPSPSAAVEAIAPGVAPGASVPPGQPALTLATGAGTPSLVAASSPVLLAASSPGSPAVPVAANAAPSLAPTPASSPQASLAPSPRPATVAASVSPAATATVTPVPTAAATATATPVPTATASGTAAANPTASPADEAATDRGTSSDDALRYTLVGGVLLYGLYVLYRALTLASRSKARVGASGFGKAGDGQFTPEPEKIETPR